MTLPTAAVAIIEISSPLKEIILIERASHPHDPWSGHLAFPGGKKEAKDQNLLDTAIRETHEEIGLLLKAEQLYGVGEHAIAGHYSGRKIFVAPYHFKIDIQDLPQKYNIDTKEVSHVHLISENYFTEESNHREEAFHPKLKHQKFPFIPLNNRRLWGFTYEQLSIHYHKRGKISFINKPEATKQNLVSKKGHNQPNQQL